VFLRRASWIACLRGDVVRGFVAVAVLVMRLRALRVFVVDACFRVFVAVFFVAIVSSAVDKGHERNS